MALDSLFEPSLAGQEKLELYGTSLLASSFIIQDHKMNRGFGNKLEKSKDKNETVRC